LIQLLNNLKTFFQDKFMPTSLKLPNLESLYVHSYEEYKQLQAEDELIYLSVQKTQQKLLGEAKHNNSFKFKGYCRVCNRPSEFLVDYRHSSQIQGVNIPNWRERLVCPTCSLNNRMRSAIHLFLEECQPDKNSKIYLTEQVTPLYDYFNLNFSNIVGSEYLEDKIPYGSLTKDGIRNESLTELTFKNNQFDFILSFDVLEHIPDYRKAFSECYRILNNNGKMLFTVPFCKWSEPNIIRAKIIDHTGTVEHLEEPVYHGDPLNDEGILCFQDFGWEMLNELREVGFNNVKAIIYGSSFYGYLGGGHIAFITEKGKSMKNSVKNYNHDQLSIADNNYNLGRNYAVQRQFTEAVEAYHKSINLNPNVAIYYHSLGDAYFELHKWDNAIASYQKSLQLNPNFAWSYYNLGRTYTNLKQIDQAIAAYQRAINSEPKIEACYESLAEALIATKKHEKAASCYLNLANIKFSNNQINQAIALYQKSVELNPTQAEVHYRLGQLLQQSGDIPLAVKSYLRAIQIKPEFPEPYLTLRNTPTNLNLLEQAVTCYRQMLQVQPEYPPLHINLADALTKQNKIKEATNCYINAIRTQTQLRYPDLVAGEWSLKDVKDPDFIIIGAGKCGTSSLHVYLMQHPQIVPPIDKEIHFFSHKVAYGKDWYLSHFAPTARSSTKLITGEASTSYFHTCHLNTHQTMHQLLPDAKLILLLRDPVERAISHYHQTVRLGQERRSLEDAFNCELNILQDVENPLDVAEEYWKKEFGYLWFSLYYTFTKEWMKLYQPRQFLILDSAKFKQMPEKTMEDVYKFLEISSHKLENYPKYNSGSYPSTETKIRSSLSSFFAPYNQNLETLLNRKFDW
jgi:tetratricopeptide (TPR) repeat protein